MKKYRLYRLVDGERYFWGEWENPVGLATAANSLGLDGFEQIKVVIE